LLYLEFPLPLLLSLPEPRKLVQGLVVSNSLNSLIGLLAVLISQDCAVLRKTDSIAAALALPHSLPVLGYS